MDAVYFIVDSVLTFAVYAFLLRLLLPLARADFRNPLTQAILKLTNWLVMPLRRVLPPIGRLDTASVVALLVVQLAAVLILDSLDPDRLRIYGELSPILRLAAMVLMTLALAAILLYTVMIFLYALLSFVAPGSFSPATQLLGALCEPLLHPIRRILPAIGGLDLSPLVALVGLQALRLLIT